MFIRETVKSAKKKKYIQHQIIESVRTPMWPRQKILLHIGTLKLKREKWKELANNIECELKNQKQLFETAPDIIKLAKHYARLIVQNRLSQEAELKSIHKNNDESITISNWIPTDKSDFVNVDLNSLEYSNARSIWPEHVMLSQIKDYGLDDILKNLWFDDNQINCTNMLITWRAVHPSSERETVRWIKDNSSISESLWMKNTNSVYDNALHRTAKLLLDNYEQIENQLAQKAKDIFSLKEKIILYDLTNTFFAWSKRNSNIAKHWWKSKERRNDRPLVTLALTVDEQWFPKRSKIYKGNIWEPTTLENVLNKLWTWKDWPVLNSEKTIVIDSWIASDDNLKLIKNRNFKYIAVSRKKTFPDDFWKESNTHELLLSDNKTKLKVRLKTVEDEAFLLCHSEAKEIKEKWIMHKRQISFEKELKALDEWLSKKWTTKKYKNIVERIGRLKERYRVWSLYSIDIEKNNENNGNDDMVTKISFSKNNQWEAKEEKFWQYIIRTNRLDLTDKEVSELHRSLTTVEESFRSMKSELWLRPNHHKNDDHMQAHIFITVLSYHIVAWILKKLNDKNVHYEWNTIRNILSSHTRVTSTFRSSDNDIVHIRWNTSPNLQQTDIYNSLKIRHNPIWRVVTKIPITKEVQEVPKNNVVSKKHGIFWEKA